MPDVGWVLLLIVLGLIGSVILVITRPYLLFIGRPVAEEPYEPDAPEAASNGIIGLKPRQLWERALNNMPNEAPHLFIYGPSGSGKTVFAQHLIADRDGQVVVLDPKWQAGKWGGAPAYTVDSEGSYGPIDAGAAQLIAEFRRRLLLHQQGQSAPPLTVILDELPDLNDECPQVRKLFLGLLRMGRELGMRLVALSTGRGVEDLGLKGRGDARRNLVVLRLGAAAAELRPDLAKKTRLAVLEIRGQAVPLDLSAVRATVAPLPLARHWQPLVVSAPAIAPAQAEKPATQAESPGKALESAESGASEALSEVEQAMIRGAVQAGKGKTETLQALKGYSGRRHRAYSAAWEEARGAATSAAAPELGRPNPA